MSKSAIQFSGVSKRFVLHHDKARSVQDLVVKTLGRRNGTLTEEEFWALRDISFDVTAGERVGLIGPNGAGKSTALKLIGRIFKPTTGQVSVNGRLSALIELTAGFHPDLTGRENIYLNGALMGLRRSEIQKHFDDIVAFSELENFIDTQVKHYSTGMHLRLGFAIASCIESDILLVDELLSVGDANFQRKCFERIDEIRARGTTIFWVTHSMPEVERICSRTLLLMNGRLMGDGSPADVIAQYEALRRPAQAVGQGPFAAEYSEYQVPSEMDVNGHYEVPVSVCNRSTQVWYGEGSANPDRITLTYHWLDRWGGVQQLIGLGIPLSHDLGPGESSSLMLPVIPPIAPGMYRLEIDMALGARDWFSRHGCLGPQIQVQVYGTAAPEREAASPISEIH